MSDSVGSVSVDVVPDARGWAEKLRAQIHDATVKVKAEAETSEAKAELDETARTRTAKIRADVDKSALSRFDSFLGGLSSLPAIAIAAGAALIPLAGAIGGVVAALAAPLAIAGGGAGLFALLSGLTVQQTLKQTKNVDKLRGAVDSARTSLENARRSAGKNAATSASVAAAQERLNKATADYQTALKGVSPQQAGFVRALDDLKLTFTDMLHGPTGRSILATLTDGVQLLTYVLRDAGPFIRASSKAFGEMLRELGQAVSSPGFSRFIAVISRQVGSDLLAFGHIIGNIAKGLGGLFTALGHGSFSGGVLDELERLTHSFAEWGNSRAARRDVREFFDYAHRVGPQVAHTIGAVASALAKVVEALAPLGPVVLKGIQVAADSLAAIPIPVLTALAAAFAGTVGFQKLGGFKALGAIGGALQGARTGGVAGALSGALSGSVQKVFVVNMPGAGLGGGGDTFLGRAGDAAKRALPVATGLTATDVAAGVSGALTAAGIVGLTAYALRQESKSGPGSLAGNMTPAQWAAYNRNRLNANTGLGPGTIATPTNPVHQLTRQIGAASQGLDLAGARGAQGFAEAAKQVHHLSMELAAIQDPHLRSVTDHVDALRDHLARASRSVDLIGPHANQAFGQADQAVDTFRSKLAAIHDKQIRVILQDQAAVQSLEALQRMRIADKNFNIYAHYQAVERGVGPGGGMGQNPHGSAVGGSGGGGARTPVHVHLDSTGRATLTGYMSGAAQDVYDQNQRFARDHG